MKPMYREVGKLNLGPDVFLLNPQTGHLYRPETFVIVAEELERPEATQLIERKHSELPMRMPDGTICGG